ncbi:unnamed protein product [Vitrella brassicaformis CCMP3155]|uniref:Ribosome recycling factor domain-containing protein n=2 Tax=Vitrella brassicaformis TaxID=1169539 RepID=A0A0G4EQF6_VITBC|nr:unnamed protein product [Vitrella brassicaformis CCMP3155]|mmetsp:Transcript_42505/g.120627  ORF Transcript_42505/g.120627 Transcript_42505/m.120627 type:complete len:294 (-) Transcript_42505:1342-2223(-)|eukprot:CEL99669.1 unnamed protein product [Vitrella brassicaformis CCMP3155]
MLSGILHRPRCLARRRLCEISPFPPSQPPFPSSVGHQVRFKGGKKPVGRVKELVKARIKVRALGELGSEDIKQIKQQQMGALGAAAEGQWGEEERQQGGPGAGERLRKFGVFEDYNVAPYAAEMDKLLEGLKSKLAAIKMGRATPDTFEGIQVQTKAGKAFLTDIAQVVIKGATTVMVNVFDEADAKKIISALRAHDNSWTMKQEAPTTVRLDLPKMTTEIRDKLKKKAREHLEQTKLSIQDIRNKGRKEAKKVLTDRNRLMWEDQHINKISSAKVAMATKLVDDKCNEIGGG